LYCSPLLLLCCSPPLTTFFPPLVAHSIRRQLPVPSAVKWWFSQQH